MAEVFTGAVTVPGLYPDVPEDKYHADPVPGGSLSHSGIKTLVFDCPAIYDYQRQHPKPSTKAMDLGTVVHGIVLDTGPAVVVLDYPNYQRKEAQQQRDAAAAAGKIPMLSHQYAEALAIADAVLRRPNAAALFADGDAEVSGFWHDDEYGIWGRLRIDWLTWIDGMPTIVDFKTAASVAPDDRAKSAGEFGYYLQDPYYRRGLAAILNCDPEDVDFIFAAVSTTPPYLVQEHRLLPVDTQRGAELCRIGMETFRDCTAAGVWPTWSDEITDLPLPSYQRIRAERIMNDWHGITYDH